LTLGRLRAGIRRVFRHTVRVARLVAGLALLAIGVLMAVPGVPGPGIPVIVAALGVLGGEFEWADRWNARLKDAIQRLRGDPR
jgi:hypothetical protein